MSRGPRSQKARRYWGDDDSDTSILHVDMDAFFVSVELLKRPELRGKPVAVGGTSRGVVSAASYEARRYGVNSAMPVGQARRLCPHLIMISPDIPSYREKSVRIMKMLEDVTPLVEKVSVDEAFLDVSGARRLMGSPVQIATDIRQRIRQEEGVAASIGIAATKHVAKIASAHAKPDGLLLVPRTSTLDFLHGLPVGAMLGVGDKTRVRLEDRGIETVGDLAALGRRGLVRILGKAAGEHLYALSMGEDTREVVTTREDKTYGKEITFFDAVSDRHELEKVLLEQAHATARRLRMAALAARTVSIKVRFADFTTITRSRTLGHPSDLAAELYGVAKALLSDITIVEPGLRLLGLRAEQLVDPREGLQLTLDSDERHTLAERTLDALTQKFGKKSVMPASLISSPAADHHDKDGEGKKMGKE